MTATAFFLIFGGGAVAAALLSAKIAFHIGWNKGSRVERARSHEERATLSNEAARAYEEGARMAARIWRRSYDENHERWQAAYRDLYQQRLSREQPVSSAGALRTRIDVLSVIPSRPKGGKPS